MLRRISIQGISGSGKTTVGRALAARLGVPHVETDALVHGPGWAECSDAELRAAIEPVVRSGGWVIDSDYRRKLGTMVLENADTVVWLDLPLRTSLRRLFGRTYRRMRRGEELWNGNRESWRGAFWGRDSLFVFAIRKHVSQRRTLPELLARPELAHLDVVRLRSSDAVGDGWGPWRRRWMTTRRSPMPTEPLEEMYARGRVVRAMPLDRPVLPHEPRRGTPPSERRLRRTRRGLTGRRSYLDASAIVKLRT